MTEKRSILLSALALAAAALPAVAAPINNTGFETGPTTPVTPNDWQYNGAGAGRDGSSVHSGSFAANLDNTSAPANANVQQQTAFGSITPGTSYTLSFYTRASYGDAGEGQLLVGFMNSSGGFLTGSPNITQIPASAAYTLGTRNLVAPANASAFFVQFSAVTGAVNGATSHLWVDDVVLASQNVPEPVSLSAVGAGAALVLRRRRRA